MHSDNYRTDLIIRVNIQDPIIFCSFALPTTADSTENKVLKEFSANLAALMVVKN